MRALLLRFPSTFPFFFSIAFDFLPQVSQSLLSPALLNFNTFCINLTGFENGDKASNKGKNRAGSRKKDWADSGNKGGADNKDKNGAAIIDNGSTSGSFQLSFFHLFFLFFLLKSKYLLSKLLLKFQHLFFNFHGLVLVLWLVLRLGLGLVLRLCLC